MWNSYYQNGNIKSIDSYLADDWGTEADGELSEYSEQGQLTRKSNYNKGKLTKQEIYYKSTGTLAISYQIQSNNRDFDAINYNSSKNIESEGTINSEGKGIGNWKYFNSSGKVIKTGSFVNGKKLGEWKYYNDDGKVNTIETYSNDKLNGPAKAFHSSGQLWMEGDYTNGKQIGEWKTYDENGKLTAANNY